MRNEGGKMQLVGDALQLKRHTQTQKITDNGSFAMATDSG